MEAPTQVNPANETAKRVTEATRVPMSVPQMRLEIPAIPGFHLHWFLGRNVPRAQQAGYEFVQPDEVALNQLGIAADREASGSSDMGTRVSVVAGGFVEGNNEAERLYLMKLRQEWRDKDVAALEARNELIAAALRGGKQAPNAPTGPAESEEDARRRYMKQGQDLFYPKKRKGS